MDNASSLCLLKDAFVPEYSGKETDIQGGSLILSFFFFISSTSHSSTRSFFALKGLRCQVDFFFKARWNDESLVYSSSSLALIYIDQTLLSGRYWVKSITQIITSSSGFSDVTVACSIPWDLCSFLVGFCKLSQCLNGFPSGTLVSSEILSGFPNQDDSKRTKAVLETTVGVT